MICVIAALSEGVPRQNMCRKSLTKLHILDFLTTRRKFTIKDWIGFDMAVRIFTNKKREVTTYDVMGSPSVRMPLISALFLIITSFSNRNTCGTLQEILALL